MGDVSAGLSCRSADARFRQHQRPDSLGDSHVGAIPRSAASSAAARRQGIIGRIQTPAIARSLCSGLPLIVIELTEKQLSQSKYMERVSEIRADSQQAGRAAADHLLDRGFTAFGFCGYQGRIWSYRRRKDFASASAEQTPARL